MFKKMEFEACNEGTFMKVWAGFREISRVWVRIPRLSTVENYLFLWTLQSKRKEQVPEPTKVATENYPLPREEL